MIPRLLRLKNFMSHTDSELDFDQFEAALVMGSHNGDTDVSNGVGKCLPGGTLLYDVESCAMVPISEFVKAKKKKTLGLVGGKVSEVDVYDWMYLGARSIYRIVLESGAEFRLADTHPVLTPSGCIRTKDLSVGDWVGEARKLNLPSKKLLSVWESLLVGVMLGDGTTIDNLKLSACNDDVMSLCRAALSDTFPHALWRSYDDRKNYTIVNGASKQERRKCISELISDLEDAGVDISSYVKRNAARIYRLESAPSFNVLSNIEKDSDLDLWKFKCCLYAKRSFLSWLNSIGIYGKVAHTKYIPSWMLFLPRNCIQAIISGLWMSDGYVSDATRKSMEVSYCSTSKELSLGVRKLLLRLGIVSKIHRRKTPAGWVWNVSLPVSQFGKFLENATLLCGFKKERLERLVAKIDSLESNPNFDLIPPFFCKELKVPGRSLKQLSTHAMSRQNFLKYGGDAVIVDQDVLWSRISFIEKEGRKEECFDITVHSDEHLYIADTLFVHNSAVFDALVWALFDKCRFRTKDKVIKRGKPTCCVEFEFDCGGSSYKVVRKLGVKGSIEVSLHVRQTDDTWRDLSCDTSRMTNKKILEIVKVNHDTFINSVYFKQHDLLRFSHTTASERKEILKDLLQIGIWDRYQDKAKAKTRKLSDKREALNDRIGTLGDVDGDLDKNRKAIAVIELKIADIDRELVIAESELESAQESLGRARAESGEADLKAISRRMEQISSRRREIISRRDCIREEVKENNEKCRKSSDAIASLSNRIGQNARIVLKVEDHPAKKQALLSVDANTADEYLEIINSEVDNKKEALEHTERARMEWSQKARQLETLEPGKKCPTCFQEVNDLETVLRDRKKLIKKAREEFEDCTYTIGCIKTWLSHADSVRKKADNAAFLIKQDELSVARHNERINSGNRANERLHDELGRLAREWNDLKVENESLVSKKKRSGSEKILVAEKTATTAQSKAEHLRKIRMDLGMEYGNLQGHAEDLQRRMSERRTLLAQKINVSNDLDVYKKLVKAFGKNGVQAIIMENVTDDLRNYANSVLKRICNDPMTVDFITQKQTAKGSWSETFDIKVSMQDGVVDFDDLSGGEQVRISIALRLALSRILMRRVGSHIRFLLLDEVDQALDKKGLQSLAEMIYSLSKEFKVMVITHNDNMKDRFEHVITIHKELTGSMLRQ